ncbi:hypothetical protein [Natranaerobius trueperi]|nr:hypothetical protein [Natranaerobius trueperi]
MIEITSTFVAMLLSISLAILIIYGIYKLYSHLIFFLKNNKNND